MNAINQKTIIRSYLAVTLGVVLFAGINIPVFAASGKTVALPPPPPVTTTTTQIAVPSGVGFPVLMVVGSAPITVTFALVNTGTIPLVIDTIGPVVSPVTISGTGPGFCAAGMTLPTGTALTAANPTATGTNVCLINVTFDPAALGSYNQFVPMTFQNAPVNNSVGVNTLVMTADPVFQVAGSTPFPPIDTPLGTASTVNTIFFNNAGLQPLIINDISFSGANPSNFSRGVYQVNCGRCSSSWSDCQIYGNPITLPSFKGCALTFNFRPTVLGSSTATVSISTNDPLTPVKTLSLSGNGVPALIPPPPVSAFNVTDIWATPGESAWKLSIVHHQKIGGVGSDVVDATFDTFDMNAAPTWFTIKNGIWTSSKSYTGEVHQANGTFFDSIFNALDSIDTIVGTATLSFIDANNAGFTYTINGVTVTKTITRTAF